MEMYLDHIHTIVDGEIQPGYYVEAKTWDPNNKYYRGGLTLLQALKFALSNTEDIDAWEGVTLSSKVVQMIINTKEEDGER